METYVNNQMIKHCYQPNSEINVWFQRKVIRSANQLTGYSIMHFSLLLKYSVVGRNIFLFWKQPLAGE